MVMTYYMQKFKVSGQSVGSKNRVETDGQTASALLRLVNIFCIRTVNYGEIFCCVNTVCNFGQDWEVGYLTGVHTQYKALLPKEITATVGVRIGLRSVNITLLGT